MPIYIDDLLPRDENALAIKLECFRALNAACKMIKLVYRFYLTHSMYEEADECLF